MSKWKEIRCGFFDEEEGMYYVDAWEEDYAERKYKNTAYFKNNRTNSVGD